MLQLLTRTIRRTTSSLPRSSSFLSPRDMKTMKVVPVPVREDNYAYLLIDEYSHKAAAIDPYSVPKVKAAADQLGVDIVAALTTHHHFDHSGGNEQFASTYPDVPIYGGSKQVPALSHLVKDQDVFSVGSINVKCLATPCHTQDSICYYVTDGYHHLGGVFTGDTLFIAGCGRFFEGTAEEMHESLSHLGSLPDQTVVYDGHEYTASNLKFALSVDPDNVPLARLGKIVSENQITTGLSTIGDEKQWNPFMRVDTDVIRAATGSGPHAPPSLVMQHLRTLKNNFRG